MSLRWELNWNLPNRTQTAKSNLKIWFTAYLHYSTLKKRVLFTHLKHKCTLKQSSLFLFVFHMDLNYPTFSLYKCTHTCNPWPTTLFTFFAQNCLWAVCTCTVDPIDFYRSISCFHSDLAEIYTQFTHNDNGISGVNRYIIMLCPFHTISYLCLSA